MIKYISEAADGKLFRLDNFAEGCWIDLVNPTDDECDEAVALSGVGEDMIKAALDEEERARIESDGDARMFIVDCPIIEEGQMGDSYTTLPLAIIEPEVHNNRLAQGQRGVKGLYNGQGERSLKRQAQIHAHLYAVQRHAVFVLP